MLLEYGTRVEIGKLANADAVGDLDLRLNELTAAVFDADEVQYVGSDEQRLDIGFGDQHLAGVHEIDQKSERVGVHLRQLYTGLSVIGCFKLTSVSE